MIHSNHTTHAGFTTISPLKAWILATRPKTLPAAVAPVIVGAALAIADHQFAPWPVAGALLAALLLQIGVNLANDYFDSVKGIDSGERLGPIRVTQSGLIPPGRVKTAMQMIFLSAMIIGAFLAYIGGWPIIIIGITCVLAALAYSGGPYPLASHGLGDVFVFIFFGWVAVCGTYYLQTLSVTPLAFLSGTQVGLLITAILVVNNLRDIITDSRSGKITLAVKIGAQGSKREYVLLTSAAYLLLPLIWLGGWHTPWILLPLFSLPMAVYLQRKVWKNTLEPQLNQLLAETAGLSLLFSVLLAIGLVLN
jgi:1,4-dihydroxy-2-naphthoate octaprenyltransferase